MFVYSVFILGMVKNMTRYEHIVKHGIKEMAKVIAYFLYMQSTDIDDCEIMRTVVKNTTPIFVEWLSEEIEE